MNTDRDAILQEVLDQLADLSDLSLVLLTPKSFHSIFQPGHSVTRSWFREVCVTDWRNCGEFLQLLFSHDPVLSDYLLRVRDFVNIIWAESKKDIWKPQVFRCLLGLYHFVCPLSQYVDSLNGHRARALSYYLLGGAVHLASNERPSWKDLRLLLKKLEQSGKLNLSRSSELEIITEAISAPVWNTDQDLLDEIEGLRLTLNGIVRTYLTDVELPQDVRAAVVELYQSVRSRRRFSSVLESLLNSATSAKSALLAIRHEVSGTGFVAFHNPGHSSMKLVDQWLFVPREEDVDGFLLAESFQALPEREMSFLDLGFEPKYCMRFPIAVARDDNPQACLWLLRGSPTGGVRRRSRRLEIEKTEAFLDCCQNYIIPDSREISRAVQRAKRTMKVQRKRQLARHIARPAFLEVEPLTTVLRDSAEVVGSQELVYYQAQLYETPPIGRPLASWPLEEHGLLELREDLHGALFSRVEPRVKDRVVYQPVAFRNRTLGVLKASFVTQEDLETGRPLIAELANRLAGRIPHRRLSKCIDEVIKLVQLLKGNEAQDREAFNNIASQLALLVGESASSIWIFDAAKREFRCIGRAGVDLQVARVSQRDSDSVVVRTYEATGVTRVNLMDRRVSVKAREELRKRGFRQGLGMSSRAGDLAVVILIWSKVAAGEDHFSEEDEMALSVVAFMVPLVLKLQSHLARQSRIRDETMVHLGHELKSPLSGIYSAIEVMKTYSLSALERTHLTADVLALIDYEVCMVRNLLFFAEIEGLVEVHAPRKRETKPYRPFEDIVFRVQNILGIFARGAKVSIQCDFPPARFPEALYLTETEKAYLESILFNLISNAIKYTFSGKDYVVHVVGGVIGKEIVIRIENTGIGVPKGEEMLIFDKCKRGSNAEKTAPPGGSGLGLYISRRLAEVLGGQVELTSNTRPTTFQLCLPLIFSENQK